jgi:hypothetical protein
MASQNFSTTLEWSRLPALIGHPEHRIGRVYLVHRAGDVSNAILAAAGTCTTRVHSMQSRMTN